MDERDKNKMKWNSKKVKMTLNKYKSYIFTDKLSNIFTPHQEVMLIAFIELVGWMRIDEKWFVLI